MDKPKDPLACCCGKHAVVSAAGEVTIHDAAETFPLSEYLWDEMRARRWGVKELATAIRHTEEYTLSLVNGDKEADAVDCALLAMAFGSSVGLWENLAKHGEPTDE